MAKKYRITIVMKDGSKRTIDTDTHIKERSEIKDPALDTSMTLAFFICDPSIDPNEISDWVRNEMPNGECESYDSDYVDGMK